MSNTAIKEFKMVSIEDLREHPSNPRIHPDSALDKLQRSIEEFGFTNPILVSQDGYILAGHARLKASKRAGLEEVPAIFLDLEGEMANAYLIADNKIQEETEWDLPVLKDLIEELDQLGNIDVELTGFSEEEIDELMDMFLIEDEPAPEEVQEEASKSLVERFIVPPFTILDGRQGYWRDRRKVWLSLGIKSELGRSGDSYKNVAFQTDSIKEKEKTAISVFDPVLCEIIYTWFSKKRAVILDPFAGGSVRGIVAGRLGREYHGIDIREEQVISNRSQVPNIPELKVIPKWYPGDSQEMGSILPEGLKADLIFSCPPYADLEVYSDNPKDLSNMEYPKFLAAYQNIIKQAVNRLKEDSFACFVVGDIRNKEGYYRNFVSDTIGAFLNAGMNYYNEAVLLTPNGSLAQRIGNGFADYRKLGKSHQNVLVFYKGNPKRIPERLGEIELEEYINAIENEQKKDQ